MPSILGDGLLDEIMGTAHAASPRRAARPSTTSGGGARRSSILGDVASDVMGDTSGEGGSTFMDKAASVGRAALDVIGAPKRAVDVAANYYSPGGERVLSEGLTPVVPTTGELVKEAVFPEEDARTSYGKAIGREVLGFATDLGTDPITYAGFGSGVPGKVAGAAFTGLMAHGAVESGKSAYEEMIADGFSPEVAAKLTRALLEGGGAARHLLTSHPANDSYAGRTLPEVVPETGRVAPELGTPREAPFVAPEQPFSIPADRPFDVYPFEAPAAAPAFVPEAPPVDVLAERDFLRPDMTAATNAEQARLAREYVSGNSTLPGLDNTAITTPGAPRLGAALPTIEGRQGAEAVSFSPRAAEVAAEQGVRVEPQTATTPEIAQRDSQEAARMAKKLAGFAEPELRRRLDFYQKVGFPESLRLIRDEVGRRQAAAGPTTPEGQPLPASTWDQLTAKEQADVATTMGLGFSKGAVNKMTVDEARAAIPRRPPPPSGEVPPAAAAPAPVEPPAGPQPPAGAAAEVGKSETPPSQVGNIPPEERRRDAIVDRRETASPVNLERRVAERRARILEEDPTLSESHAERIARAEDEARTDPLTGLENGRAFEEALKTHAGPVVSLDLAGLGYVNDHLGGHPAGDAFLKAAADALREEQGVRTFRAGEKADEFALLADTPEAAEAAAKSVQERFSNAQFSGLRDGQPVRYTGGRIDYGVGTEGPTAAERFKHGDTELYTSRERAVEEGLRPGTKGSRPPGLREVAGPGDAADSSRAPQGPLEPSPKFAAAEAPAKGAPVTADHVRAAFPTGKIEPTDHGFRVSMPHGREIRVDTHGEIEYDPAAFHAGHPEAATGDKPAGSYQRIGREAVIALAKTADQSIVHHEAFHAAMDLALSPKERESVLRHYKDEEAAADAYSKWNPRAKTNSFFGKIRDFFRNIYRSFKPTWESAFEQARSGKAFERSGKEAVPRVAEQYATAPKAPPQMPEQERKLKPIPDRPEPIKEAVADRAGSILSEADRESIGKAIRGEGGPTKGKPSDFPINLDRIGTEADVKALEGRVAESIKERLGEAKGYRSWGEARTKALASGLNEADFVRLARDGKGLVSDHVIEAGRILREETAKDTAKAVDAVKALREKKAPEEEILDAERAADAAAAKHAAVTWGTVRAGAEAGRALAIHRKLSEGLAPEERFFKKLLREVPLMTDAQRTKLARAVAEKDAKAIADTAREAFKPSVMDKFLEFWKAGLVSGPPTIGGNFLSNTLFEGWRTVERGGAGLLDAAVSTATGKARERYATEALASISSLKHSVPRSVRILWDVLSDPLSDLRFDAGKAENAIPKIGGKTGEVIRTPLRILQAFDQAAKHIAEQNELYARAYRMARMEGAKDVGARMSQIVNLVGEKGDKDPVAAEILGHMKAAAAKATFQDEAGKVTKGLMLFRGTNPLWHLILPFLKTPSRIFAAAGERTPYGFLKVWKGVKEGKLTERGQIIDEAIKPAFGTMLGLTFVGAAAEGLITGSGPADPQEKKLKERTGWQEFSVKVGDQYISYKRMEPLATLMGLAADYVEASNEDRGKVADKIQQAIVQNLSSKTYLQGVANFAEMWADPKRYYKQFFRSLEGSLVPNILAKTAAATDETQRDTTGLLGPIANRLPGVSHLLPEKRSGTGEVMERQGGSALERFASPTPRSSERPGADLEREMLNVDFTPTEPKRELTIPNTGGKVKVKLTPEEFRLMQDYDEKATERLRRVLAAPGYKAMPTDKRKAVIERAYREAATTARNKIMRQQSFRQRANDQIRQARSA